MELLSHSVILECPLWDPWDWNNTRFDPESSSSRYVGTASQKVAHRSAPPSRTAIRGSGTCPPVIADIAVEGPRRVYKLSISGRTDFWRGTGPGTPSKGTPRSWADPARFALLTSHRASH